MLIQPLGKAQRSPSTGPRSHSKFKANPGFDPRPPASKAGCRFTVGTKQGAESMVPSPKVSPCLTSTGHRLSVGFPESFSTEHFLLCFECFFPPLTPSMLAGLLCPVLCSPIQPTLLPLPISHHAWYVRVRQTDATCRTPVFPRDLRGRCRSRAPTPRVQATVTGSEPASHSGGTPARDAAEYRIQTQVCGLHP